MVHIEQLAPRPAKEAMAMPTMCKSLIRPSSRTISLRFLSDVFAIRLIARIVGVRHVEYLVDKKLYPECFLL